MNTPTIFRYDLSQDIVDKISEFANLHKDDVRAAYKEAWELWCQENEALIVQETRRLETTGYEGNVRQKMYTAGRYYFRKKSKMDAANGGEQVKTGEQVEGQTRFENIGEAEERKEPELAPIPKRGYVKLQSDTLISIDNHIKECFNNNDFTPANGYQAFAQERVAVFRDEREHLKDFGLTEMDVREKLKKTYKNRYYTISRNINKNKN